MAKIIKKILIYLPLFLICFTIKNVYAEEYNFYFIRQYNRFQINISSLPISYEPKKMFSISALNNNFDLFTNSDLSSNVNLFFYNKKENKYIGFYFPYDLSNCDEDTDINIVNSLIYCKVNSDYVSFSADQFIYTIEDTNSTNFIKTFCTDDFFGCSIRKEIFNDNLYSYQLTGYRGLTTFKKYIFDNINDLDLLNKSFPGNFYVNNEKIDINSPDTPEPEPEPEPEIEPPIYNYNLSKYYVPNYVEGQCVEVLDKDTLRVFENENSYIYTDYFINSHYISKTGQVDIDYVKKCSSLEFTDIRYYSTDFPETLFILTIICVGTFGFPYLLYKRFRKR